MINKNSLKIYAADGLNVLLSGKHGVGKTAIIKEVFNEQFGEHDVSWKYFSASTLDPWVDFIGIPKDYQNSDGDTVFRIVPPESFTGKEKIEAIFLDEINRADEKTLNAIMELIQFRSINGRKFPHLKCVWAAENPADDDENDYSVRKLDPAQRDRFQIQLKVPYNLDKEYMVNKYGKVLFDISNEWWNGGKGERKKVISPRKLDDMLAGFSRGYDIADFTTNISVEELKKSLESVGRFDQYRIIAQSNDVTNIKNFFTIDKIRQAENLFPTLDPKNTIFNVIYPHLADEIKKYITRTFKYDYSDRNKVQLNDKQLKFITSMGGIPTKPNFTYDNSKNIRESISNLVDNFSYKDVLVNPILDASDLKIIMPFEYDEDIIKDAAGNIDLAKALTTDPKDLIKFKNFFKFVLAGCVLIGRTKGIDYLKDTNYFKFISKLSRDPKTNSVIVSALLQMSMTLNDLNPSNMTVSKRNISKMKIYSTVNHPDDIIKSVTPFLVAFPAFDFIYRGGGMSKLVLNEELPRNVISICSDKTLMVQRSYTTAFVSFDKENGKNISFEFNKYFAETNDDIERSFVFAHEAMHVLLDHGKAGDDFLKSLPEEKRSNKILNVAMDVCINELLVRECFENHAPYMNLLKNMCLIDTVFTSKGIVVEPDKGFEYYYHKIIDNMSEEEFANMTMFSDQADYENLPDWAKDMIEDIADKSGYGGDINNAADNLKKRGGHGSGSAKFEPVVTQYKKMNVEDAIARYIKPRNMSAIDMKAPSKSSYKWYGMDRRNISIAKTMPNMNIPIRQTAYKNKKMRVVVYCDVSGSVSSYTKKFLSIIDLIENERSEVLTYVWADSVGEAKRSGEDKYRWNGVGGGTNINAVFNHFYAHYPQDDVDAVIVLTDGEYQNIQKYNLKGKFDHTKWKFFMTTTNGVKNVIDKSVSVEIDWNHYGRDL